MSKKKSKKDIKAERKMLVSVINKQKKTEEKREKINIPETIMIACNAVASNETAKPCITFVP